MDFSKREPQIHEENRFAFCVRLRSRTPTSQKSGGDLLRFSHEHNLIEHSYNILTLSNNTVGKISLFTLLLHLTGSGSRKILQKQFCFMSKKNSARHLGLQFNLTPIFVRSKRHLSIHLPNY